MMSARDRHSGFSLLEVMVATSILMIAVGMSITVLYYVLKSANQSETQNELDMQVQLAMERIKYDMRLSSLGEMFFSPAGSGPYGAISFPMARDDDGDGAVDLDADGHIIWDRTMIYHVWQSVPYQLRLTIFDTRDNSLSDLQRQQQIDSVVLNGNGASAPNSANATTTVVFQNLFTWIVSPASSTLDAYSDTEKRTIGVALGSALLSPGDHTFAFTVQGKNPSSSGYHVGVDNLFVSPSYGLREGEAQLPATAYDGPAPAREYKAGGSWAGNYHLLFPATDTEQSFTLTLENDRWEETNFDETGDIRDNTTVEFVKTLSPYDYVVQLQGLGYTWMAYEQTGDTNGIPCAADTFRSTAVRVLIQGEEMANGDAINFDGNRCLVMFRAGAISSQQLKINAAYIAECSDSNDPSMDAAPGTTTQLTFDGGPGWTVPSGVPKWSDLASFSIDKDKSYLVTFLVDNAAAMGNPWIWRDYVAPATSTAYIIPGASAPTAADAAAETWSSRADVITTNVAPGVQFVYTTYPQRGVYTSRIFDTQLDAPEYIDIDWSENIPSGAGLDMRVRSGNSNDLSDAAEWTNVTAMASPGAINPGDKRYVQFHAELQAGSYDLSTPLLKDVTIRWTGQTQVIDIGGTFTKGPDYGIFKITVDGVELKSGLMIDLEIYKDVRGLGGMHTITSRLKSEVRPRNSGK